MLWNFHSFWLKKQMDQNPLFQIFKGSKQPPYEVSETNLTIFYIIGTTVDGLIWSHLCRVRVNSYCSVYVYPVVHKACVLQKSPEIKRHNTTRIIYIIFDILWDMRFDVNRKRARGRKRNEYWPEVSEIELTISFWRKGYAETLNCGK